MNTTVTTTPNFQTLKGVKEPFQVLILATYDESTGENGYTVSRVQDAEDAVWLTVTATSATHAGRTLLFANGDELRVGTSVKLWVREVPETDTESKDAPTDETAGPIDDEQWNALIAETAGEETTTRQEQAPETAQPTETSEPETAAVADEPETDTPAPFVMDLFSAPDAAYLKHSQFTALVRDEHGTVYAIGWKENWTKAEELARELSKEGLEYLGILPILSVTRFRADRQSR